MNGGIEVDSAPGKGSTFVARVWLENDEAQAPVSLEERFRHLKALVVDADAEEREYTCSLLLRFGVAAEGFASGDMALGAAGYGGTAGRIRYNRTGGLGKRPASRRRIDPANTEKR